jgi:hypothetical protein
VFLLLSRFSAIGDHELVLLRAEVGSRVIQITVALHWAIGYLSFESGFSGDGEEMVSFGFVSDVRSYG